MKQIHKTVQALESDIGFWRTSWILLKKLKNANKIYRANFLRPICILKIFRNNLSRGVWLYYQILMMAKMCKTEIPAKILKRKILDRSFYYQNHTKNFSAHGQGKVFPLNQT